MDVESLLVKVESSGVEQTNKSLDKLAKSADSAGSSVDKLSSASKKAQPASASFASSIGGLSGHMQKLATGRYIPKTASDVDGLGRSLGNINDRIGLTIKGFSGLGTALLGVGAGAGALGLLKVSDTLTQLDARMRTVIDSEEEFIATKAELIKISTRQTASLEDIVRLYTRSARATEHMNLSQGDLFKVIESTTAALRVNGATATEAGSAMLQLSQAIGSGVLRGEEFNAVYEAAPNLLQAVADSMGVPIGQMRKLAEEGKITSDVLINALIDANETLVAQSKEIPVTIGQAWVNTTDKIAQNWAKLNKELGINPAIVAGIQALGANSEEVFQTIAIVGAAAFGKLAASTALSTKKSIEATFAKRAEAVQNYNTAQSALNLAKIEAASAETAVASANARLAASERIQVSKRAQLQTEIQTASAIASAAAIEKQAAQESLTASVAQQNALKQEYVLLKEKVATEIEVSRVTLSRLSAEKIASAERIATIKAEIAAGKEGALASLQAEKINQDRIKTEIAATKSSLHASRERLISIKAEASGMAELAAQERLSAKATLDRASSNLVAAQASAKAMAARKSEGMTYTVIANQSIDATKRLSVAQKELQNNIQNLATAQKSLAATGFRGALSNLSAMLGGPLGIATMAATAGAAFLLMRDNAMEAAEKSAQSMESLGYSLEDVIAKLKEKNELEKSSFILENTKNIEAQTAALDEYQKKIFDVVRKSSLGPRPSSFSMYGEVSNLEEIFKYNDAAKVLDAALGSLFEKFKSGTIDADKFAESIRALAKSSDTVNAIIAETGKGISGAVESMLKSQAIISAMKGDYTLLNKILGETDDTVKKQAESTDVATKEWTKFLDNLKKSAETFGMNNAELAEYEAKLLGATDAQIQQVKALAGQQDAFDNYVDALKTGRAEEIAGAEAALNANLQSVAAMIQAQTTAAAFAEQLKLVGKAASDASLYMAQYNAATAGFQAAEDFLNRMQTVSAKLKAETKVSKSGGEKPKKDTKKDTKKDIADITAEILKEAQAEEQLTKATLEGEAALEAYNVQRELEKAIAKELKPYTQDELKALEKAIKLKQDNIKSNKELEKVKQFIENNKTEQQKHNDKIKEHNELLELARRKYPEYAADVEKAIRIASNENEHMLKLIENGLERLDDSFGTMWEDMLKNGEFSFTSLKDMALSTLAEIIHAYTTKKIIVNLGMNLTGEGGTGGGLSSLFGGGGQGGGFSFNKLFDMGKNVWDVGKSILGFGASLGSFGMASAGLASGAAGLGAGSATAFLGGIGATGIAGGAAASGALGAGVAGAGAAGGAAAGAGIGAALGSVLPVVGTLIGAAILGGLMKKKPSDLTQTASINFATGEEYTGGLTGKKFSQENLDLATKTLEYATSLTEELTKFTGEKLTNVVDIIIGSRDGLRYRIDGVEKNFDNDINRLLTSLTQDLVTLYGEKLPQEFVEEIGKIDQGSKDATDQLSKLLDKLFTFEETVTSFNDIFTAINLKVLDVSYASMDTVESLGKLAGGIDVFLGNASYYFDNFFKESEKSAKALEKSTDALKAFNEANELNIQTAEQYRTYIETLDPEKDQQKLVDALDLAWVFEEITNAFGVPAYHFEKFSTEAEKTAIELAKSQAALEEFNKANGLNIELASQYREYILSLDPEKDIQKWRDAMNIGWVFEAIGNDITEGEEDLKSKFGKYKDALKDQYDAAMDALNDRMKGIGDRIRDLTSLSNGLKSVIDKMGIDNLERYTMRRTGAIQQIRGADLSDPASFERLLEASQNLGEMNTDFYSTFEDYEADLYESKNALQDLKDKTDNQISIEEQTLKVLKEQMEMQRIAYEQQISRLEYLQESGRLSSQTLKDLLLIQSQYLPMVDRYGRQLTFDEALQQRAENLGITRDIPLQSVAVYNKQQDLGLQQAVQETNSLLQDMRTFMQQTARATMQIRDEGIAVV